VIEVNDEPDIPVFTAEQMREFRGSQAAAVPEAVATPTAPVKQWRIATNRHPNTDGTRWGWIEGAPGNICWSDERGSNLTRAQAGQMVLDHNNALAAPEAGAGGGKP
jgi:hypothetical protein